jgi:hypothetical protein
MPARKMRVELFDSEGNKYTIGFEGQISRDKALKLLDMVELLGGLTSEKVNSALQGMDSTQKYQTKYDRLYTLVRKSFPTAWFSSKETQQAYEQEFKEPIGLSTVSTYLARLAAKGLLSKNGSPNSLKYRAPSFSPSVSIKPKIA